MPLVSITEWFELLGYLYHVYGYLNVFLSTLGENTAFIGFLLPGISLAVLGAFYARLGILNLGWVIFLASLGTVLGYHIDYLFGRFVLAHAATRWSSVKLGRSIRMPGRLRMARMLLKKHGGKPILMSRIVGHLRSF